MRVCPVSCGAAADPFDPVSLGHCLTLTLGGGWVVVVVALGAKRPKLHLSRPSPHVVMRCKKPSASAELPLALTHKPNTPTQPSLFSEPDLVPVPIQG